MNSQILAEHFEVLADTSGGPATLRQLILRLAVFGKLVPQDANDDSRPSLVEQIEREQELVESKKELAPVDPKDLPMELPKTWACCRLGSIALVERGGSPRPIKSFLTDDPAGFNWIKIGDTEQGGKYITSTTERITQEGLSKTRQVFPGDFLLTNSMSYGRPYITKIEGCIHDGWLRIHPPSVLEKDYLYYLLSSPYVGDFFKAAAAGAVVMNLNSQKVRELPIPIPPLNEQRRIITKVDELMALCDELEAKQTQKRQARTRLNAACLDQLVTSQSPAEFAKHWQRIHHNFDLLYDSPKEVEDLDQVILDLAVTGRLPSPSQGGDDEVDDVLAAMDEQSDELVAAKLLRRDKSTRAISESELPFGIPASWRWVRLGRLARMVEYGTSQKASASPPGVPVLRMGNIQSGNVILDNLKYMPEEFDELPRLFLLPGDLLFNRTNSFELVGKTGIYRGPKDSFTFASYLIRVALFEGADPEFINMVMNSRYFRKTQIEPDAIKQCGQANFNGTKLKNTLVPLPPVSQQVQLVEAARTLRGACEEVRGLLVEREKKAAALLGSLVSALSSVVRPTDTKLARKPIQLSPPRLVDATP